MRTRLVAGGVVVGLGALALENLRRDRSRPALTGRMVPGLGSEVHCVEAGTGPAVVLLHGNPGSVSTYVPGVLEPLSRDFHVVAVDRPGHGHSPRLPHNTGSPKAQAAAIRAAVRGIGVRRPIVVGHSWSGAVALSWAVEFPDDISGLVLAEGTFYEEPALDDPTYAALSAFCLGAVLAWTVAPVLARSKIRRRLKVGWAPMAVPAGRADAMVAEWSRPGAIRSAARDVHRRRQIIEDLSRRWPEVAVPTTILACPDDQFVDPIRHAHRLHEAIPGSTLVEVPGCGHVLPDARPDAVVDAVRSLAAQLLART
jgi:pimeloyl-ACP methyl ester carboxylesterase